MLLAGQARTRARRASTTLASAWRMRAALTSKKQTVANITRLQVSQYRAIHSLRGKRGIQRFGWCFGETKQD